VGPLEGELARTAGTDLAVAPCAGTVVHLHVQGVDAVVRDGDVLGEVPCAGNAQRADLTLPAEGIPLVQPGQTVKLLYDAFPFQRYGVGYGTVRWSGPAGTADSGAFRALVDIDARPVVVRGRPRPLMPGMAGRARTRRPPVVDQLRVRADSRAAREPRRRAGTMTEEGVTWERGVRSGDDAPSLVDLAPRPLDEPSLGDDTRRARRLLTDRGRRTPHDSPTPHAGAPRRAPRPSASGPAATTGSPTCRSAGMPPPTSPNR
jgi:hypothetical protein